jgi:hypothetical protein
MRQSSSSLATDFLDEMNSPEHGLFPIIDDEVEDDDDGNGTDAAAPPGGDIRPSQIIKGRNRHAATMTDIRTAAANANANASGRARSSTYDSTGGVDPSPLLPPEPSAFAPTTVMRRGLDEVLSFSYSLSGTGAILSLILLFFFALLTGGPAVMVWGWLLAALFSAIVVANIAEICSAYPRNAGSVYYWAGQLAPKEVAPVVSFWTAIFALFAYTSYAASYAYGFAILVSSALGYSGYQPLSSYEETALAVGTIIAWGVICYLRVNYHDVLSHLSAFLQITLALAIIVAVVIGARGRYNTAEYVFTSGVQTDFSDGFYQISFILAVGVVSQFYPLSEFSTKVSGV